MKLKWSALGGQMGIGFVLVGVLLLFLGWNGAASYDRVPAQFPYLISGGLAGVGLMVVGGALLIVQNSRADRAALQQGLLELRDALDVLARSSAGAPSSNGSSRGRGGSARVVAGPTSFHRPACALLDGRAGLPEMTIDEALAAALTPCRACEPLGAETVAPTAPLRTARVAKTTAKRTTAKKASTKKATTKKTTAKKAAGRKATAKKGATKKAPARKTPARQAAKKQPARRR